MHVSLNNNIGYAIIVRMSEISTPKPKDIQFDEALNSFKGSRNGHYELGISDLQSGKYPNLSNICPWQGNKELAPESLWMYVIAPYARGNNGVYAINISTRKRLGYTTNGNGIYDLFNANATYNEAGLFVVSTDTLRHSPGDPSHGNSNKKIILQGEAKPPAIPDEKFMDIFLDFAHLVEDWRKFAEGSNRYLSHG